MVAYCLFFLSLTRKHIKYIVIIVLDAASVLRFVQPMLLFGKIKKLPHIKTMNAFSVADVEHALFYKRNRF